jgi:shikimate dehydrogenase
VTAPPRALRLAVIGDPVAHSASPALHRGFLAESGLTGTYEAIRVAAGTGAREITRLRDAGYTGLNVTTPLKEEAYAFVDECDPAALASGAVNTIVFSGSHALGSNTDGIGALGALREAGLANVAGARVLVLGAGPTARAAIVALFAAGARPLVWNRTREKAEHAAEALGATLWDGAAETDVDAVFATLSPGADVACAALRATVARAPIVVDANYADRSTLAAVLGREVVTGLAMLRASARASFDLFCRSIVAEYGSSNA